MPLASLANNARLINGDELPLLRRQRRLYSQAVLTITQMSTATNTSLLRTIDRSLALPAIIIQRVERRENFQCESIFPREKFIRHEDRGRGGGEDLTKFTLKNLTRSSRIVNKL